VIETVAVTATVIRRLPKAVRRNSVVSAGRYAEGGDPRLGGQVQVYFGTSSEDIKAGRLRALAVTTATRLEALPNVPTIGESARSFEASSVFSIDAPRNTPVEIVDTLNKKMNANLADPKIEAQFAELGGSVLAGSPAKFAKLIAHETEKWGQVIRMANIKPE
jgi:tripartite-type tricarboxylate transporter receptor subunit TctC